MPASTQVRALVFRLAAAAAVLYGVGVAWRRSWVSDDAYITFRYADNLARGLGLVFNEGERVEGYSNFLWTVWISFGLWIGSSAERWATIGGLACYLAALGLLAWNAWASRREAAGPTAWLPIAAMLAALHPDWNLFATSGLETSLFALEVTLVYVLLARGSAGPKGAGTRTDARTDAGAGPVRAALAGVVLGVASMTRPDGPIFAGAAGLYLLIAEPRRVRAFLAFAAAFLALWVPYTLWRVSYFGDYFPNTYYAKSAAIAWYKQGAFYTALYFQRYWPLLLGPALVLFAWRRRSRDGAPEESAALGLWRRRVLLAAILAAAYMAFVIRVGGDFMFGRFLIPITPLLLILIELGITRIAALTAPRPRFAWIVPGVVAAGILFTPYPLPTDPFATIRGIVFEPNFYSPEANGVARRQGQRLRPFFEGLPVCVAFYGGEAAWIYYARPRVALECVTGLTDRRIARQPIEDRGRVGHEKLASPEYVLNERRAHLTFFKNATGVLNLDQEVPRLEVDLGGDTGRLLTWDPVLVDSLRARGGIVPDFPAQLDELLERPSSVFRTIGWLRPEKLRRFYFEQVNEPEREALFLQRVRESDGGG
ncbi:MAG TPA: hypothetical protein VLT84_04290 [Acidobacteriota bacterium]|nr:hypothetical protein [Acidobacteriota bacterium]